MSGGGGHSDFWTLERIEQLKALWQAETLSARQIAGELGVSKSAVIAKANRLGLHRSPEYIAEANRIGAQRGGLATAAKHAAARPKPPAATPAPRVMRYPPKPEPPKPTEAPPAKKWQVHFNKAGFNQCRWPLWPDTERTGLVCGAPSAGKAYCTYHGRVSYTGFARKG
jgi:hypothetical protein